MENGDEITIYLPDEPITHNFKTKNYAVLDDKNNLTHYVTLADIAEWIAIIYY